MLFSILLTYLVVPRPTASQAEQQAAGPRHDKIVVCYLEGWALRRHTDQFALHHFEPRKCTHLVYVYARVDSATNSIVSHIPQHDLDNKQRPGNFVKLTSLKFNYPHLKVLLNIGGSGESAKNLSDVSASTNNRERFAENAVEFLRKHKFDGLDIKWQHPGSENYVNLVELVKVLRYKFLKHGFLLTVYFPREKKHIEQGFDVASLMPYLDFVGIASYHYFGPWNKKTGPNTPLHSTHYPTASVESTVNYFLDIGVPSSKMVIGLAAFGHSFLLVQDTATEQEMGSPTNGSGIKSTSGFIGYNEICKKLHTEKGWLKKWHDESSTPFITNGRQLMSFDDEHSIDLKVQLLLGKKVAGLFLWSLNMDDQPDNCGSGSRLPLLTQIDRTLINKKEHHYSAQNKGNKGPTHGRIAVCYMMSWAVRRPAEGQFTLDHIDPSLCTHLVYVYAGIDAPTNSIVSLDPANDLEQNKGFGAFKKLTSMKKDYSHLKILLGVGGWIEDPKKFSSIAASRKRRQLFASNTNKFLREYNFDGLEINWQLPLKEDKDNFVALVKELRAHCDKSNMLLAAYVSSSNQTALQEGYDVASLAKYLDYVFVEAFSYYGPWNGFVGPHAPLKAGKTSIWATANVDHTVNYLLGHGVPSSKLVLGVASFGRPFLLKAETEPNQVVGAPCERTGFEGTLSKSNALIGYNEVCQLVAENRKERWVEVWDQASSTVFAVNRRKVIAFDNEQSLTLKVQLLDQKGLAGVLFWSLDTDDFRGTCGAKTYPLLRHIDNLLTPIQNRPQVLVESHEYGK